MNSFSIMLLFLTRIPLPWKVKYSEDELAKGIKYMPAVGLLIGGILYVASLIMEFLSFDRGILNLSVWILYVVITGGLHIDGLADTFDGIYSNRGRERVLEIMKDSHIGTFGVLGIFGVLGFAVANSHYLGNSAYFVFPVIGRAVALVVCGTSKYARQDGMGKVFVDRCGSLETGVGLASALIISAAFQGLEGLLGALFSGALALAMGRKVSKTVGGITGDTIGFTVEFSQMSFLAGVYLASKILAL